MKKMVFVVAPEVFRDEEYIEPKTILESAGIEVTTASTVVGEIYGKIKIKAQSQMLAKDIKVDDFDGIFFVGGNGASVYFEDEVVHDIARQFYDKGKIVSAICIAPVILANAGLLQNKKATVFPSGADILIQNGANYTGNSVIVILYETKHSNIINIVFFDFCNIAVFLCGNYLQRKIIRSNKIRTGKRCFEYRTDITGNKNSFFKTR